MTTQGRGATRPKKEAFFVQVKNPDDKPVFYDATAQLGRPMPYSKPLATCALRVNDGAVVFSLLKLTNRTRQNLAEANLEMPRGPLAKLERRAAALVEPLPTDRLLVEYGEESYTLTLSRDENGTVSLDMPEGAEDVTFELPKSAVQLSLYLTSPKNGRTVAVGFIGHLAKPGTPESLTRAVAHALNYLSGLPVFRLIAGIETVNVPAAPSRWLAQRVVRKPEDEVVFAVPVRLWTAEPVQPVGQGYVQVKVDLDTANPVSGRLLFNFAPDAAIAETFEPYRSIMEAAVSATMTNVLGVDEVSDLVFSIALGELGQGDLGRLREAAAAVTGLDLSPKQWGLFAV